jgi:hypothetical protein
MPDQPLTLSPAPRVPTRKRDEQVRRKVRALTALGPGLADVRYRPALHSLARLTLLVDRAYLTLKARTSLVNDDDGELCSSIDSFRRLVDGQASLLKSLGLMPTSVVPDARSGSLDAVYQRIEKIRKVKDDGAGPTPSPQ